MKNFILFSVFICSISFAEEVISPITNNKNDIKLTNEIENLQWNKYVSGKFTILSISDKQGKWLYNNVEDIKNWCLSRWGIKNYSLKNECRIMMVPNKDLLKRFFNLEENRIEFREKEGKLEISAVWLCLEEGNKDQLVNETPKIITSLCIHDLMMEKNINKKFIEIGMSSLNQSNAKIKNLINNLENFNLNFLKDNYDKLNNIEKERYEINSLFLCLMLKKEFGEANFLKLLLSKDDSIKSLEKIYSFKESDLSSATNRYIEDIKNSIKNKTFNNKYLNIERVKK